MRVADRVLVMALARLDHSGRGQVLGVTAQLHSIERGPRVEVGCLLRGHRRLLAEALAVYLRVVDSGAHRDDRLDKVGGFAQHGAQLVRLAVVAVLFTSRGRPRVDLLLDHAREANGQARLGTAAGALCALLIDLETACAIAMTCRSSSVL